MHAKRRRAAVEAESLDSKRVASGRVPTVFQVMTREVATAYPGMSLSTAVEAMVEQDIGHLPVVDEGGFLVGILSKTDVVRDQHLGGDTREVARSGPMKVRAKKGIAFSPGRGFHVDAEPLTTVGDVMSKRVITVRDDEPISGACRLMVKQRFHGVPVVDARKKLVGFLSTFDVCEWVAGE